MWWGVSGEEVDAVPRLTFHDLLSHSVVELLLSRAGLKDAVEVVRLTLRRRRGDGDG